MVNFLSRDGYTIEQFYYYNYRVWLKAHEGSQTWLTLYRTKWSKVEPEYT